MYADQSSGCVNYYWCVAAGQSYYESCAPGGNGSPKGQTLQVQQPNP